MLLHQWDMGNLQPGIFSVVAFVLPGRLLPTTMAFRMMATARRPTVTIIRIRTITIPGNYDSGDYQGQMYYDQSSYPDQSQGYYDSRCLPNSSVRRSECLQR